MTVIRSFNALKKGPTTKIRTFCIFIKLHHISALFNYLYVRILLYKYFKYYYDIYDYVVIHLHEQHRHCRVVLSFTWLDLAVQILTFDVQIL